MKLNLIFKILLLIIIISSDKYIYAQETTTTDTTFKYLSDLSKQIWASKSDSLIKINNAKFIEVFEDFIKKNKSTVISNIDVYGINQALSDDEKIHFFTWIVPLSNNKTEYYGFVKLNDEKVIELNSKNIDLQKVDVTKNINSSNWYGSIYFDIVKRKYKGDEIYILLGWNLGDYESSYKLIETLVIKNDEISFGKPIIVTEKGTQNRAIFGYKYNSSFVLRYDEQFIKIQKGKKVRLKKEKMIVLDRLVSLSENTPLSHLSKFKVPAGNIYDGFIFKKGMWRFVEDIEARNEPIKKKDIKK